MITPDDPTTPPATPEASPEAELHAAVQIAEIEAGVEIAQIHADAQTEIARIEAEGIEGWEGERAELLSTIARQSLEISELTTRLTPPPSPETLEVEIAPEAETVVIVPEEVVTPEEVVEPEPEPEPESVVAPTPEPAPKRRWI